MGNNYFIVQARAGSKRLPNKILLPFYKGKSILELLIEKLVTVPDFGLVVATSYESENDSIEKICNQYRIKCFRGEENDVLQRFIDAAQEVKASHIIRICSDNPFIELDSIKKLVDFSKKIDCDYISFNIDGTPAIKTHYGFWSEYVSLKALEKIASQTQEEFYHEHVTNYIYEHPEQFEIKWLEGPSQLLGRKNIRLTIDTYGDFESAKSIYEKLCEVNPFPTIGDIITYLDNHIQYYHSMEEQISKNSK